MPFTPPGSAVPPDPASESRQVLPLDQRPTKVRHMVVAITTLMSFLLYLDRLCFSFAERYIKADLGLTDDQIAWTISAFFWSYALAQVPTGWLSDRYGARTMLTLYVLIWSVFTALIGVASGFVALVIFRLGLGLSQAGAYPTAATVVAKWATFTSRGIASSIIAFGGRVGGAVAPPLTAFLIVAFSTGIATESASGSQIEGSGWRAVMIVYGLAGLVVVALFWILFRNRPSEHPGCNAAEVDLIESSRPADAVSPHGAVEGIPMASILSSGTLWLVCVAQMGTNIGWMFLVSWLPRYLQEVHEVPIELRGWMSAAPLFIGMVGGLLGGWLTDRLTKSIGVHWGRVLPISSSRFLAAASFVLCLALDSPWPIVAALCVVSFATDIGSPAIWAFSQDVGGRHTGSILGWGNMWGNIGAAISPVLLNKVIAGYGWDAMFLTCAGAFVVAGVASLFINPSAKIIPENSDQGSVASGQ